MQNILYIYILTEGANLKFFGKFKTFLFLSFFFVFTRLKNNPTEHVNI